MNLSVQLALLAGFGGVIALMAVAGADSIRVLRRLEADHQRLTKDYLAHHHAFERIHHLLYSSGTLVEDALMDSEPASVPLNQRSDLEKAIEAYSTSASTQERELFAELKTELAEYLRVVDSALVWAPEVKRRDGPGFLQREVLPRRTKILAAADQMDALNDQALRTGDLRSAEVFERFRNRTIGVLGLTLTLGFGAPV